MNIYLNDNHRRLLVALSLWARVRIVYGRYHNFELLTRPCVAWLANENVCGKQTIDALELQILKDTKHFSEWRQSFVKYLRHQFNKDGVPLSYVIRDETPPATFKTLLEELMYLVPVDMSDATFR